MYFTEKEFNELQHINSLTLRQKEVLNLIEELKDVNKVTKVLGISKKSVYKILKRIKDALEKHTEQKTIGTSVLYKYDEESGEKTKVLEWVKSINNNNNTLKEIFDNIASTLSSVPVLQPIKPLKIQKDSNLLVAYINTDLHLGQYSWGKEAGVDVNAESVYNNTIKANQILLDTTPNSEQALIVDLGDTLHASNDANRTKSGHELDVDSRHAKIFEMLVNMKIELINNALYKHDKVRYIIVAGNHSDLVPHYLIAMLKAYYKDNPRFEVDDSVTLHKYYRFGKTLLGFHHGHATKMQRLPEVMVWDRKEDISETEYRYWLTGHVHRDSVYDNPIARCESFRNATPNDAWATGAGYRSNKQTVAITYHKEYGEIAKNICPINML